MGSDSIYARYRKRETFDAPAMDAGDPRFERLMLDVDRAVARLKPMWTGAIETEYRYMPGCPPHERAGRCRCSVPTYYYRLRMAKAAVAEVLHRGGVRMFSES